MDCDATVSGAIRQKVKLLNIAPMPPSSSPNVAASASSPSFSGATRKMTNPTAMVTMPRVMNTPRQSVTPNAASTGTVPESAPSPPMAIWKPEISGSLPTAKNMRNALNAAIRHADTPNPMSARPATSPPMPDAVAKTKAPSAANINSAASVRLGPKRSSSMPSGNWKRAKVRK